MRKSYSRTLSDLRAAETDLEDLFWQYARPLVMEKRQELKEQYKKKLAEVIELRKLCSTLVGAKSDNATP